MPEYSKAALRISYSFDNTEDEIRRFCVVLKQGLKTALSGGDNMIMLIPQNSENEANALNVTVNFKKNGEEDSASTSFNLDFKEGRIYTLTMNFIGDEVQLITASEANWDTADDVDHVFD